MAQEYKKVRIKRFAQLEEHETPEGQYKLLGKFV